MIPRTAFFLLMLALAAPSPARAAPPKDKPSAPASRAPAPGGRAGPGAPTRDLKLKPGGTGVVCLECHGDFEDRLKKAFVHTPVRSKNCIGCHNPHASDHGKLLAESPTTVCLRCHSNIVPADPRSSHKPVAEGRCVECHDPHSSAARFNLVRAGNDLCAGCHKPIAEAASSAKYKHAPVQQSCVACHTPHGSAKGASLLKHEVPGLCADCHPVDKPIFAKQHMGYPVSRARCTQCHDPHGSNNLHLLYGTVHPPVAKGNCTMCHEPPTSPTPFKTRQAGVALCRGCHSPKVNAMLEKSRTHQPVAEGACLACHTPHASAQKGLLKGDMVTVCGACHVDTIRRQVLSSTKHDPVQGGKCTKCHDPHSSDTSLMFVNTNGIELCGSCHDWQKHATHPIGESKKDPRNKNLTLQCLSCHRAHGTEYKHMVPYAKTTDLCTKCHEQFKR